MHPGIKYALIGTGVVVGGYVLYRVVDAAMAPSLPAPEVSPNPAVAAESYGGGNRAGESDATAISRVFERAIGAAAEGYQTYTREVSQTNRANAAAAAQSRTNDAARDAKLRAVGGAR